MSLLRERNVYGRSMHRAPPGIIASVLLAVMMSVGSNPGYAQQPPNLWGLYSNVVAEQTEPSGLEMYFFGDGRAGQCNASVLLQIFEGSPQYPEVLDCCACSHDKVVFDSAKLGSFKGRIVDDALQGEFLESKFTVQLKRGSGFWQR